VGNNPVVHVPFRPATKAGHMFRRQDVMDDSPIVDMSISGDDRNPVAFEVTLGDGSTRVLLVPSRFFSAMPALRGLTIEQASRRVSCWSAMAERGTYPVIKCTLQTREAGSHGGATIADVLTFTLCGGRRDEREVSPRVWQVLDRQATVGLFMEQIDEQLAALDRGAPLTAVTCPACGEIH
jgi:hypothetical protein